MSPRTRFSQASTSMLSVFLIPLCLAMGAWSVGILNGFQASDGLIYDALMRWRAPRIVDPPRVLLLEVDEVELSRFDAELPAVLERLFALGAKLVVFSSPPRHASASLQAAPAQGKVVIGRGLEWDPFDPLSPMGQRAGEPELPAGIKTGIVTSPSVANGISRTQTASVTLHGEKLLCLEAVAASEALGAGWKPP